MSAVAGDEHHNVQAVHTNGATDTTLVNEDLKQVEDLDKPITHEEFAPATANEPAVANIAEETKEEQPETTSAAEAPVVDEPTAPSDHTPEHKDTTHVEDGIEAPSTSLISQTQDIPASSDATAPEEQSYAGASETQAPIAAAEDENTEDVPKAEESAPVVTEEDKHVVTEESPVLAEKVESPAGPEPEEEQHSAHDNQDTSTAHVEQNDVVAPASADDPVAEEKPEVAHTEAEDEAEAPAAPQTPAVDVVPLAEAMESSVVEEPAAHEETPAATVEVPEASESVEPPAHEEALAEKEEIVPVEEAPIEKIANAVEEPAVQEDKPAEKEEIVLVEEEALVENVGSSATEVPAAHEETSAENEVVPMEEAPIQATEAPEAIKPATREEVAAEKEEDIPAPDEVQEASEPTEPEADVAEEAETAEVVEEASAAVDEVAAAPVEEPEVPEATSVDAPTADVSAVEEEAASTEKLVEVEATTESQPTEEPEVQVAANVAAPMAEEPAIAEEDTSADVDAATEREPTPATHETIVPPAVRDEPSVEVCNPSFAGEKLVVLSSTDEACFVEPDEAPVVVAHAEVVPAQEESVHTDIEETHSEAVLVAVEEKEAAAEATAVPNQEEAPESADSEGAVREAANASAEPNAEPEPVASVKEEDVPVVVEADKEETKVEETPAEIEHPEVVPEPAVEENAEVANEAKVAAEPVLTEVAEPEAAVAVQDEAQKEAEEKTEEAAIVPATSNDDAPEHGANDDVVPAAAEAPISEEAPALVEVEQAEIVEAPEGQSAEVETGLESTATVAVVEHVEFVADASVPVPVNELESAPAISVSTPTEETAEPAAQQVEEPERPKSPWTPSYSVTSQGPGTDAEEPVEEATAETAEESAVQEEVEAVIPAVESMEVAHAPTASESTTSSWPVSYSVSSQGNSPLQTPQDVHNVDVEPIESLSESSVVPPIEEFVPKEAESHPVIDIEVSTDSAADAEAAELPVTPQIVAIDEDGSRIETVDIPDVQVEEPIVTEAPEAEAPAERPWTPSYSVSQQGSSPAELPSEEPVATPEPTRRQSWTPSYSVSRQGSISSLKEAAAAQAEPAPVVAEPEPAVVVSEPEPIAGVVEPEAKPAHEPTRRQSWTPSYSISRQGSRSSLKEPEAPPVVVSEPEVIAAAVEAEPESKVEVSEPSSQQSWTPSYSVSRQGSRSSLKEAAAPAPEPEAEAAPAVVEPKPIWTPSYSVSHQGSRSSLKQTYTASAPEVEPVPVVVTEPEAVVNESASAPEPEQSKPSWTPSYSISRQGSRSSLREPEPTVTESAPVSVVVVEEPQVIAEAQPETKEDQPERPWTPSYSVSHQGTSPALATKELEPEVNDSQAKEVPERPWTPSYSVSRQGSSPLLKSAELPEESQTAEAPATEEAEEVAVSPPTINIEEVQSPTFDPAAVAPAVEQPAPVVDIAGAEVERPASPWTPSYSVQRQGSSPKIESAQLSDDVHPIELGAEQLKELASKEVPERPWTPSYSVVSQGPVSPSKANGDAEQSQTFPTTEIAEMGPKVITKASLARLTTVDEHAPTHVTSPPQIEETPLVSPGKRTRNESGHSSVSSRFFPGGWFSGNSKTPEENRTSIDHAAGEFTRLAEEDGRIKGRKSAESPAVEAPATTPVEGVHHEKKKHRMCVIQ